MTTLYFFLLQNYCVADDVSDLYKEGSESPACGNACLTFLLHNFASYNLA